MHKGNLYMDQGAVSPKRKVHTISCRTSWYPYYAGFSIDFAKSVIHSASLPKGARILDPWNGSGTTTYAAALAGHTTIGFDLNPVMVIAAKAMMLNQVKGSLLAVAAQIARRAKQSRAHRLDAEDPLLTWFAPSACNGLRAIENSIRVLLIDDIESARTGLMLPHSTVDALSAMASFFYVALFRTVRMLLKRFIPSNPTWIRKPASKTNRLRTSLDGMLDLFSENVYAMNMAAENHGEITGQASFSVASSTSLPVPDSSIDMAVSSPPYCTRIDYAVATRPELAILGYSESNGFRELRRNLIGTTTVPCISPKQESDWGKTCLSLLQQIAHHASKASQSYYLKSHLQYFDSVYRSMTECSRVLKSDAPMVLVVQDSYYKNILNRLPRIFEEMGENTGLLVVDRIDFESSRNMARVNPAVRRYRENPHATESVLNFRKVI